jgi:hypothetical protein
MENGDNGGGEAMRILDKKIYSLELAIQTIEENDS